MPMPHRTQMQLIKRRLIGKEGSERVRELRTILQEPPGYRNGPYADIRSWVLEQIEETHKRSHVIQRDSIAVRREGVAQVALVGAPNVGNHRCFMPYRMFRSRSAITPSRRCDRSPHSLALAEYSSSW